MEIVAKIETVFPTKFGVPRQSGLCDSVEAKIVFEKKYQDTSCVKGLDEFSHIWLLWDFSLAKKDNASLTVRPPRLGGNKSVGVFASRSPFRPNNIGLSSVKLERIEYSKEQGPILYVTGADLVSGTPIYDIKPYLKYTDGHPDAKSGFADEVFDNNLDVTVDEKFINKIPENLRSGLISVLQQDPRPSYQNDENRIYGFFFSNYEVKFKVKDKKLAVIDIEKVK